MSPKSSTIKQQGSPNIIIINWLILIRTKKKKKQTILVPGTVTSKSQFIFEGIECMSRNYIITI